MENGELKKTLAGLCLSGLLVGAGVTGGWNAANASG